MEPPPPHPKLPHLLTNSPFMPKITITAEDDIYNIVARNLIYQIRTYYSNLSSRHTGFWRSETAMSIVGNCEKIGWKRMLTQPWIDMGDFVTRWCSNLFYPGATPPLSLSPKCVNSPMLWHTAAQNSQCSLWAQLLHSASIWRAVNCAAPAWAHLSKWKPFHRQQPVFFTGRVFCQLPPKVFCQMLATPQDCHNMDTTPHISEALKLPMCSSSQPFI